MLARLEELGGIRLEIQGSPSDLPLWTTVPFDLGWLRISECLSETICISPLDLTWPSTAQCGHTDGRVSKPIFFALVGLPVPRYLIGQQHLAKRASEICRKDAALSWGSCPHPHALWESPAPLGTTRITAKGKRQPPLYLQPQPPRKRPCNRSGGDTLTSS